MNHSMKIFQNKLIKLLKKDPFEEKHVTLFKQMWLNLHPETRKVLLEVRKPGDRFTYGDDICWILLENEKWSLADWLLEESVPSTEIPSFKKRLIETRHFDCHAKLQENCFKFLQDLIDWCLVSDTEKIQFKNELYNDHDSGLEICSQFLQKGDFTEAENIINFCLLSEEEREFSKIECGRDACRFLLEDCEWQQMNKIVNWCCDKEEDVRDLKEFLFSCLGSEIHYRLVLFKRDYVELECFYEWFCLSPTEIIQIKKDVAFSPEILGKVHKALYDREAFYKYMDDIEPCLRWCLANEEIVNDFKSEIEKQYLNKVSMEANDITAKKRLDYIVSELLKGLREGTS